MLSHRHKILLPPVFLTWKTDLFFPGRQGRMGMDVQDTQSEPDAWKVMHLKLSVGQEMKRKLSENPGEEFPDEI